MKFRKEFLLFSLVSIIFLAGCTSSSTTGTGVGLTIQSFTPSPASVDARTNVLLTLQVQNTGESDATGVTAELIGLPYTISDRIKQVGTGTVVRADPQLGLPQGEQQVVLWDIPTTARDTTASYEAKARVTYNYVTSSENIIRIVSSDYYRTLSSTDQQALKRGVISSQFTKGPLTVTIITPQPVVPRGTVALPVQIQIDNIGSGRTFLNSVAVANLDKVSLDAPGLNCPTTEVRLVQGKTGRITCQPSISVTDVTELSYKITLRYKYFADSTTTFTVVKSLGVTPTTGSLPVPLGGNGQQCRTSGTQCDSGLVCSNSICVGSGTVPTGGLGQVCKTTSPQCDTGLICSNNFCVQSSTGTTGGTTPSTQVSCPSGFATCPSPLVAVKLSNGNWACVDTSASQFSSTAPTCGVAPTGTTCPQDYSSATPTGTTCTSCYTYKGFLSPPQCRTNYENSQAVACESTAVANGHNQWNWDQHNCFFVPQPTRSAPAANNQPASSSSPPTFSPAPRDVLIGLTTSATETCRYNTTTSQTTYDSMTSTFSTTGSTTHLQNLASLPAGTYVYNALCFDGTIKDTNQFIIKFIVA